MLKKGTPIPKWLWGLAALGVALIVVTVVVMTVVL